MRHKIFSTLTLLSTVVIASSALAQGVQAVNMTSEIKTESNGQIQPPIKFATVWADSSGATHVGHCRFEGLQFKSYAPPSAPQ